MARDVEKRPEEEEDDKDATISDDALDLIDEDEDDDMDMGDDSDDDKGWE